MNYTITFSPSIDYVINNNKNDFNINGLTRVENYWMFPGGKGINATYILNNLFVDNKAIYFSYGKTKQMYQDLLNANNIKNTIAIETDNKLDIRINIKYFGVKNNFEINGPSFKLSEQDLNNLKDQLKNLKNDDIVFIMGKCDEDSLFDFVKFIKSKNAKFIIDIDSDILLKILKYEPLLIKPNLDELSSIFNKQFKNIKDIQSTMIDLQVKGAKNVIVSMGKDGSILLNEHQKFYQAKTKALTSTRSTVGCGDTLLAAFAGFRFFQKLNSVKSLKLASAWAAATACEWYLAKPTIAKEFETIVSISEIK